MNNYQTAGGVIVQSLSNPTTTSTNTYSVDDADFFAAMPVFFSQLEEALTAVTIDKLVHQEIIPIQENQVNVDKLRNTVWEHIGI